MLTHLEQFAQDSARIALEDAAGTLTYKALWRQVQQTSIMLQAAGVQRAALDLPNDRAWVIAHLACLDAEIVQVPLPPFFTAQQREHALRDAGVDTVLVPSRDGNGLLRMDKKPYRSMPLPSGTALITYTSGSTGNPKGVCLSQAGMVQVTRSLLEVLGADLARRHLSVLPLAVLLEQVGGLYAALLSGGTYVVRSEPLPQALALSQATSCILVPELLKYLLQHKGPYPDLKFAAVGGARVDRTLIEAAQQQGLPVYEGYGLSESASVVAVNTPQHHKPGTVGKILPHIHYHLAADGEMILRDPAILGYTGGVQTQGEYATGDLVAMDAQGYLTIHGRKKNQLITAYGRNVAPEWPESLLTAQPEIAQAFVYGDAQASLSALLVAGHEGAEIGEALARVNTQLPEYARIGQWRRVPPFTASNGMATGNGRLRREAILSTYAKDSNDGFLRPACA